MAPIKAPNATRTVAIIVKVPNSVGPRLRSPLLVFVTKSASSMDWVIYFLCRQYNPGSLHMIYARSAL
jgi:hypothetical protein